MPWPVFFVAIGLIYLAELLLFRMVLCLNRQQLMGDPPMGLPRSLVFATSAIFANSFNEITPDSLFSHGVGMVDMVSGLITRSTLSAVVFARLSRHESPLSLSRHVCLSSIEEEGLMMHRFITRPARQSLNMSDSLSLIVDDQIAARLWQRRLVPLDLLNPSTPEQSQAAILMHRLSDTSPIRRLVLKSWRVAMS